MVVSCFKSKMETKIIDELLEDKQQIVTYKYLSFKLDIHPNKAKQLLKDYVSKLPDGKKYSTTMVIGGTFKDNDEFYVVLAYDDHVETMRRRFKQIDFEHLYSIQPISRFDDINNALYLADSPLNGVSLPSSINKKEKRNISVQEKCVETKIDTNLPSTEGTKDTSNKLLNNHSNETKVDDKTKLDKTKKKTGMDFFAKNNNAKVEVTEKKVSPKKVPPKIASPKKSNSDFFSKFKKSNNSDIPTPNTKNEVLVENVIKDNRKMDVESPKKMEIELPKNKDFENSPSEEKNVKKSGKKKDTEKKSKKKNSQKVKRKRIQTFDSSDEEEVDSEEEDKKRSEQVMDVVEEEIDFVQPTPPRPTPRENRKKEKQTTTSTYIDDDGFICTTKEVKLVETECEPLSESVENLEPKQLNTEPASKKMKLCQSDTAVQVDKKKGKTKPSKNISSQGMKQSSLTSFFKTK